MKRGGRLRSADGVVLLLLMVSRYGLENSRVNVGYPQVIDGSEPAGQYWAPWASRIDRQALRRTLIFWLESQVQPYASQCLLRLPHFTNRLSRCSLLSRRPASTRISKPSSEVPPI